VREEGGGGGSAGVKLSLEKRVE